MLKAYKLGILNFEHWDLFRISDLGFRIFCILFFGVFLYGCQSRQLYKDTHVMMGTTIEVTSPDKRASAIVFAEIVRIEKLFSKYDPDSQISQLNKKGKLQVSPEVMLVLQEAREFWQISDGAFDPSVGPLMDLWGFTDQNYRLPSDEEINSILASVGMNKIIFHDRDNVVEFSVPGLSLDLGAIAKGFAVDCAVKKLKERQINSCLINAGGDIYCLGDKLGEPWNVAIQDPRHNDFLGKLELKDKAVATSGDYEQFFVKDNQRYAHIFDPRTGRPADSGVASVTVVAPDCLTADALATAIFVLGKTRGEDLVNNYFKDIEVKIIEAKDTAS